MCEDHADTKPKNEISVRIACKQALNHRQQEETLLIQTEQRDQEPMLPMSVSTQPQTAFILRGCHCVQDI